MLYVLGVSAEKKWCKCKKTERPSYNSIVSALVSKWYRSAHAESNPAPPPSYENAYPHPRGFTIKKSKTLSFSFVGQVVFGRIMIGSAPIRRLLYGRYFSTRRLYDEVAVGAAPEPVVEAPPVW